MRLRASEAGHAKREFGIVVVSDEKSFGKRHQKEDVQTDRTKRGREWEELDGDRQRARWMINNQLHHYF